MISENKDLTPFSCKYTPQVPELLNKLGISIGLSTYQAGKFIFISPVDDEKLVQLPRQFKKPMGIACDDQKLALVTKDQVLTFKNNKQLAKTYPKQVDHYDALYLPRMSYFTGTLDLHDLAWNQNELWAVNTLFSCIVKLSGTENFEVLWKPPFIGAVSPEDRCHLNGMVVHKGKLRYATAFNQGNVTLSWRSEEITSSGVLIDTESNETVLDGLSMPHSPIMIDEKVLFLESGSGAVTLFDPVTQRSEKIITIQGFARGLTYFKDHLFIGTSKLRKSVSAFAHLPIADQANEAAVHIFHYPTKSFVGKIAYINSVDEIYDIEVFPDVFRPNILNADHELQGLGLHFNDKSYWGIPDKKE